MMNGEWIDTASLLARQLYSVAISTASRKFIGGFVTSIFRSLEVEPNLEDRVFGSKRLDKAAFEQVNFCKVEDGRLCWIYPGDQLMLLCNVECTTLLHRANLHWVPSYAEVVHLAPLLPPSTYHVGPNSSS